MIRLVHFEVRVTPNDDYLGTLERKFLRLDPEASRIKGR